MKSRQSIIIIIVFLLSLSSCRGNNEKQSVNENDPSDIINSEVSIPGNISDLKPEEMMFLVEGAIDSWMFYNLDNYASYEAIMRKTDYDSVRNIHIHHVRFRTMNKAGGYVTKEKTFEVNFKIDENGVPDYTVLEIPTTKPYFTLESDK